MQDKPVLYKDDGSYHLPRASGVTKATVNQRTFNIRVAMAAARSAFGEIRPTDRFESIAYPSDGAVLVRRVQND